MYRIVSAGTERPKEYGRETGEQYAVIRLRIGKRLKLETIRLTDAEALTVAVNLLNSVRGRA